MATAYLVVVPDGDPVPVTADSLVVEAGALLVNQTATPVGQQAIFAAGQWCHVLVAPAVDPEPNAPESDPTPAPEAPVPESDPLPDPGSGE